MKRFVSTLAIAVVFVALQAVPMPAAGSTEEISEELQAALSAPIVAKIVEMRQEKDELGVSYRHGSYYSDFTPVGDGYEV